jgi:hypothetical protein
MDDVKLAACTIEGPKAARRFDATIRALLAVPHAEILRREAAYKKMADANPHKRGPKRKAKDRAS